MRRVGILLADRKIKKLRLDEFAVYCQKHLIDVKILSLEYFGGRNNPSFDVLLHKVTDNIVDESQAKDVQKLFKFCELNPSMKLIDPFDRVKMLMSRQWLVDMTLSAPASLLASASAIAFPTTVRLSSLDLLEETMKQHQLSFPLLLKPLIACGKTVSHDLVIVNNMKGILSLNLPLAQVDYVMQQYLNHGGVLFKCYVIGNKTHVVLKVSTPDMMETDDDQICFNSQSPVSSNSDFQKIASRLLSSSSSSSQSPVAASNSPKSQSNCSTFEASSSFMRTKHAKMQDVLNGNGAGDDEHLAMLRRFNVNQGDFDCIATFLRNHFQLSLFGFDVVVDVISSRCHVVDVNYFPGYHGVKTFFPELLDLVSGS